ncbi:DivIVA domain-containing protein [Desulforamulus putei]|uniref:Family with sequence similarity 184, A and B n=1 Tax=Desulforamulus putei DSM 12395 TaxID=1121429 RepID=A0A1M5C993_9FIRM|nr:DivIVA domain-containing protein [Desulforamulus putei]SHF51177.1 Family with sequence similarity 184, A and B [Desulforamulus putei DSM 12395]
MVKSFNKTLFGYKPGEVLNEIEKMDKEHQQKVTSLQEEIAKLKNELTESRERVAALEQQLQVYIDREHAIADVLITAQKNASRIEEEARETAQRMLEKAEEELQKKQQELEKLRQKVQHFRQEFGEILEKYKQSLDTMEGLTGQVLYLPTLAVKQ